MSHVEGIINTTPNEIFYKEIMIFIENYIIVYNIIIIVIEL